MSARVQPRADHAHLEGVVRMLDALPERVAKYRLKDLLIVYCNAAWAAGHRCAPSDAIGRTLDEFLSPAETVGLRQQLAKLGPEHPILGDSTPRPAPNAMGQWVEWVDQYLPGDGRPGGGGPEVLAVGRDVTGRHIAEANLALSEERFRELADNAADVVWRFVTDPSPHFDYVSPSVQAVLGYPASLFLADFNHLLELLDDDGRALIVGGLAGQPIPARCDLRLRRADGTIVIAEMQTTPIRHGLQGVSRDVTELRDLQDNLAALALRDPLTGLANRRLLDELLAASVERANRSREALAVAFIDLDGFKLVNDRHGHDAGDAVLCETAKRLLATVRGADVAARLGGDEFVVVFPTTRDGGHDERHMVRRLDAALGAPIILGPGVTVHCPASIGCITTESVGYNAEELLAVADAEMYAAKRARHLAAAG